MFSLALKRLCPSKREKNLFSLLSMSYHLTASCHPRPVLIKCQARPEVFILPGETTPNITALIIKEQSCCFHRMERCSCQSLPFSKVVKSLLKSGLHPSGRKLASLTSCNKNFVISYTSWLSFIEL